MSAKFLVYLSLGIALRHYVREAHRLPVGVRGELLLAPVTGANCYSPLRGRFVSFYLLRLSGFHRNL